MRAFVRAALCVAALSLAACGGGGGDAGPPQPGPGGPSTPAPQDGGSGAPPTTAPPQPGAPPTTTAPQPGASPTSTTLQPGGATTIAVGQRIDVYVRRQGAGVAFPGYLDASEVSWSSSAPDRAAVDATGGVTGIAEGDATITARGPAFSVSLALRVAGAFTVRTVQVAGQGARSYTLYTPRAATGPRPLLLSIHGGGGSAQLQASMTRLVEVAHAQGLRIAFLEGTGVIRTFNGGACCGSAQARGVDDVGYAAAVLDDLVAGGSIDTARVYASGFSNGAILSHRLACAIADRIAGIAAVGGASGQFDRAGTSYYGCAPSRPVPVLQIHAVNDRNYPYAGGRGDGLSATDYYGVEETVRDWRRRNNVTDDAAIEDVAASTRCLRYERPADATRASAPVTLCRVDPPDVFDAASGIVDGGGHSWPGGVRSPGSGSDIPVADFDASAYLWRFLAR